MQYTRRMTREDPAHAARGALTESASRVREYYDATTERSFLAGWSATGYELHFGLSGDGVETHAQSLEHTNRLLMEALAVTDADRCLDAGCGLGGTALYAARERGARVLGVTLSARQAELARGFAEAASVSDRVEYLVADYGATGLAEGSFDVVWFVESFCHAERPREVFAHAWSLLRPGGRIACLDLFRGEGGDRRHVDALVEGWVLPSFLRVDEVASLAREVGFDDVTETDLTQRVLRSASTLIGLARPQLMKLQVERMFTGRCDAVMEGHVRGSLGCAQGYYDGSVTYGMVTGRRAG